MPTDVALAILCLSFPLCETRSVRSNVKELNEITYVNPSAQGLARSQHATSA